MKRVHYEVRHNQGTERRMTLKEALDEAEAAIDEPECGEVTVVKVTTEDVPLKARRKGR